MKFIYAQEEKPKLIFGNVDCEQFFVDHLGYLCQKVNNKVYYTIANDRGKPVTLRYETEANTPIQRFIPHVERIEF
jgi:hypothetical protein